MKLSIITPAKALNKAYLKQPLKRLQIETFKTGLKRLFSRINESESEEHLKNIVSGFLRETYYQDAYYINTKERTDLVIHSGKSPSDSVAVILETKRPGNKLEMVSKKDVNVKALQELVLYYLRETVEQNNHELKHLIATNIWEWFIFDAVWFEKNILRNTKLRKEYDDWKISGHDTKHLYEHIAAKYLDTISEEVPCTYFNLKDFEKVVANTDKVDDSKLVDLYKILSPEHLLKIPFANDSNSLNKEFYTELLHVIGLEENKEGSKKIIQRKPEKERDEGSLLENTITILKVRDKLKQIENPTFYGDDEETQLFSIALELCITWLNRILFLKLLEGQLIKYHRGDEAQSFLNVKRVADYDELNELFFEVLAVPVDRRQKSTKEKFRELPYLNSSLFEETELESATIVVSELKGRFEIPVYSSTVLKDAKGKRATGKKRTLQYLFEFLDTYDFSSDSSEPIQEENKSIINASVLGLIFEKINGYKDGSYFTPGFITMYMCRETIRKAVVQKFRESKLEGFENLQEFGDLKDKIDHTDKSERKRANEIINSITICDPAVGSGHFLVSALNELIAIKSDLQILNYRDGSRVKGYKVVIENDELIITNEETDRLFDYILNVHNKPIDELQKLQEALFHEKQTIIENCLFGVDINPKSVMICRLRLWIELLKNSYYTEQSKYKDLETLPNIDINIKCGNSLISRYDINADLNEVFKKDTNLLSQYSIAVSSYKNSTSKEKKSDLQKYITSVKEKLNKFFSQHEPLNAKLSKLKGQLVLVENKAAMGNLFEKLTEKEIATDVKKLKAQIEKTEQQIEEAKNNRLYENAFEWRFEFPEVLNADGEFTGFDIVIGNPPYIGFQELSLKEYYNPNYTTANGKYDIYVLFIELLGKIVSPKESSNSFILPHKFMVADFGKETRKYLSRRRFVEKIVHFGQEMVFEDATTYTCILFMSNNNKYVSFLKCDPRKLPVIQNNSFERIDYTKLDDNGWTLADNEISAILDKIKNSGEKIDKLFEGVFQGIVTGDNDAFYLYKCKEKSSAEIIGFSKAVNKEVVVEKEICERLLSGKNMSKWQNIFDNTFIVFPYFLKNNKTTLYSEDALKKDFPKAYKYLLSIKERLKDRGSEKMEYPEWFALWNARSMKILHSPKILTPDICLGTKMSFDEKGKYHHNDTSYSLVKKSSTEAPYQYFLGVLNSNLLWFFIYQTGNVVRGGYFRFKTKYLEPVSIPITNKKAISEIEKLVDKILEKKQKSPTADTSDLEKQIDEMVYEIYGLTDEEVKIVEGKK